MKSGTSFFNFGIFKKDITRFFPVWTVYTICLCLVCLAFGGSQYYTLADAMDWCGFLTYPTAAYAILSALVLNLDLFNRTRCNTIHALPLTRDTLFGSHLCAGMVFGLIPYTCLCLLESVKQRGDSWVFLAAFGVLMAGYFIFFAITEFFAMLSGNAVGAVLLTGFFTLFSLLAYVFTASLYVPLLEGVAMDADIFLDYSPLTALNRHLLSNSYREYSFTPLLVYGGLAVLLLVGARALYRRRHLECAGDFLAFPGFAPVLVVLVTPLCGGLGYGFFNLFFDEKAYFFFFISAAVVYFVLWMLLTRSTRVFGLKNCIACALLCIVMGLSLFVTSLDPLGIRTYIPETGKISAAYLGNSYIGYESYRSEETQSPEFIEAVRAFHAAALKEGESEEKLYIDITYTLKSGRTVKREFQIPRNGEAARALRQASSRVEYVLGRWNAWNYLNDPNCRLFVMDQPFSKAEANALFDAIVRDCQEENFYQIPGLCDWEGDWLDLYFSTPKESYRYLGCNLHIPPEAANTRAWLETNVPEWLHKYAKD